MSDSRNDIRGDSIKYILNQIY